jgi:signal transduction histidine kinase
MYIGAALLVVVVGVLAASGIHGAIKFRDLTKSVRARAAELPLTANLNKAVADLRVSHSLLSRPSYFHTTEAQSNVDQKLERALFPQRLAAVQFALNNYHDQLEHLLQLKDRRIGDASAEIEAVGLIRLSLRSIERLARQVEWSRDDDAARLCLEEEVEQLQRRVGELPGFMQRRMDGFAEQVRAEYYSWVGLSVGLLSGALCLLSWLIVMFRKSLFKPLEALVQGSRRVARGDYQYRIECPGRSEVGELASAFNEMTGNFYQIKTDLDEQVRLRTKEIVRKEQLASVGFLAAGVAHEINNPLAAIAWSAESLEMRLHDILNPSFERSAAEIESEIEDLKKYLRRIQNEAFRCKEITSGLLDFSRLGDARKTPTAIFPLLESVVDMVRPLSKYRDRHIELICQKPVVADVNPQEIRQVVLNLLTNGLDSLTAGGTVSIRLSHDAQRMRLVFEDDGCGMTEEVQQHLFEPFFTRRRDGQGTGLGLSITFRIIEEHGGTIRPFSAGVGRGSCFTVEIPLKAYETTQRAAA